MWRAPLHSADDSIGYKTICVLGHRWMEHGEGLYLFPTTSSIGECSTPTRGSLPLSASQMTVLLKQSTVAAGVQGDFSMPLFRSGGDGFTIIMQKAFWENPKTIWRYLQLAQVVSPGSSGYAMIPGVTEEQYRLINEFPLSEQSRSWGAFGNEPIMM